MKRIALLFALSVCALFGQGIVQEVSQPIPSSTVNAFVVSLDWQGDGVTGAVPVYQIQKSSPIQGWRVVSVEFRPGSPSPTSGYSVQLLDFAGIDLLAGAGSSLSATASQLFAGNPIAPPLFGSFTLNVTGQGVAGAHGKVLIYFAPVVFSVGSGIGSGVTSVFGRTGVVTAAANDYNFNQLAGLLATSQVATPQGNGSKIQLSTGATTSGDCAKFDVNGNIVDNGSPCSGASTTFQVDGVGLSSSGTVNFQDSNAFNGLTATFSNPSAGNVKLGFSGTLGNGGLSNSSLSFNGVTVSLGGSGTIGCAGGGVNAQTAGYTLAASDNGGLVTMNGASLTATLANAPPSTKWCSTILNLNSTALTVSRNTLTINGGTANVTLLQYQAATFWTDGSNYFAAVPIGAGSNVTLTPSSSGMTIAVAGAPPTGTAGGDLSGTYPNPTVAQVNGAVVPTSATVVGTNASKQIVASTMQGNGAKVQLSTGTTTTNDCVKFDANGNTVDAGAACGGSAAVVPRHIQSRQTRSSGTVANLSSRFNVGSGDTVIVAACWEGATSGDATVSDNRGTTYTQITSTTASTNKCDTFTGNTTSAGAWTVTPTYPTSANFTSLTISDFDGTTVLKTADTSGATAGSPPGNLSITTTVAGDLIWAVSEANGSSDTFKPPSGFTYLTGSTGNDAGEAWMWIQPSAGLVDCTPNQVSDGTFGMSCIALKHN